MDDTANNKNPKRVYPNPATDGVLFGVTLLFISSVDADMPFMLFITASLLGELGNKLNKKAVIITNPMIPLRVVGIPAMLPHKNLNLSPIAITINTDNNKGIYPMNAKNTNGIIPNNVPHPRFPVTNAPANINITVIIRANKNLDVGFIPRLNNAVQPSITATASTLSGDPGNEIDTEVVTDAFI